MCWKLYSMGSNYLLDSNDWIFSFLNISSLSRNIMEALSVLVMSDWPYWQVEKSLGHIRYCGRIGLPGSSGSVGSWIGSMLFLSVRHPWKAGRSRNTVPFCPDVRFRGVRNSSQIPEAFFPLSWVHNAASSWRMYCQITIIVIIFWLAGARVKWDNILECVVQTHLLEEIQC